MEYVELLESVEVPDSVDALDSVEGLDSEMVLDSVEVPDSTSSQFGGPFSYCLLPTSGGGGFIALGVPNSSNTAAGFSFTLMRRIPSVSTFYVVALTGISVGGALLAIPPSAFSSGMVIYFGTVITGLLATAYAAVTAASDVAAMRVVAKVLRAHKALGWSTGDPCSPSKAWRPCSRRHPAVAEPSRLGPAAVAPLLCCEERRKGKNRERKNGVQGYFGTYTTLSFSISTGNNKIMGGVSSS
uniref:Xylanase inhibitor C-terminal domain-containing protein n=1 Tax=Oryza nivara TaxID=4536 RepID=A0A0E0IIL8_ORYNI